MAMSTPAGNGDDDEVIADINTTPLIDVMLVLLIMLIITIPIQTHSTRLEMPQPSTATRPAPPPVVRLEIGADGALSWSGEPVADAAALQARLAATSALPEQPEFHVRPDAKAAYKHVAAVMAAAQRNGLTKIGIVGSEQFLR